MVERSTEAGSGRRLQGVLETAVYDSYAPGVTINAIDVSVLVSVVACRTLAWCHHSITSTIICQRTSMLLRAWASAIGTGRVVSSWLFSLSWACILRSGIQDSDKSTLERCLDCSWCCRSLLILVLHAQHHSPLQFLTLNWEYVRSMTAWRRMALR